MIHRSIHSHFVPDLREKYTKDNRVVNRAKRNGVFELIMIQIAQFDLLEKILMELKNNQGRIRVF